MKFHSALAVGFAAALACAPALAETTAGTAGNPPPQQQTAAANAGNHDIGTATIRPTGIPPSQRNPLLTDNGEVRISKLLGADIYNKNDKDIGSVQEVLATGGGQLQVVVSSKGKDVLVPWNKLQFGDAKLNDHNKVLMLNATQQSLAAMPEFHPQKKGKG